MRSRLSTGLLKELVIYLVIGMCFIMLMTMNGKAISVYHLSCGLYAVFLFRSERSVRRAENNERRENAALSHFISEVRHYYYRHHMADEAVRDAAEAEKNPEMRKKAEQICDVLFSDDINQAAEEFKNKENNRYVKLFLTLCIMLMEYGEQITEGQSRFMCNLMNLKEEIRTDMLRKTETKNRLMGFSFVTVFPVFFLEIVENWGKENLPELESFYESRVGKLILVLIFAVSVISYCMLLELRAIKKQRKTEHFVLILIERLPLFDSILSFLTARSRQREKTVNSALQKIGESMNYRQFLLWKILLTGAFAFSSLLFLMLTKNGDGTFAIIMIMLLVTCLVFFIPNLLLIYAAGIMKMNMEEEVMQYYVIITMILYCERISVYEILLSLESFSVIFKRSISDCLNDYFADDILALTEMKSKEKCEAFCRLAEQFLRCDEIGVQRAFDEIMSEREYYEERRKQEFDVSLKKKGVVGQVISFIPLILTVGLYLIVPFAIESIRMLIEFSKDLSLT